MKRFFSYIVVLGAVLVLASCGEDEKPEPPPPHDPSKEELVLSQVEFADLPGWAQDNHGDILEAFLKSCTRLARFDADAAFGDAQWGVSAGDIQAACEVARNIAPAETREFFEHYFVPFAAYADGVKQTGLFTGYYEAGLQGSRSKVHPYIYPLYARPDDLVMVDLGQFRDHLKGERIAGRVIGGNLRPYEERAAIEAGNWPHNDKVLVWVDDPVAAFFLHIQGSGVVALDDGTEMRVGYAGQNGHPYYAIGRELIARGYLAKEEVSLQSIRAWLLAHPDQADEIMNTNKSYVFFHKLDTDGPVGGQGVTLTPRRSLAIDYNKIPYGMPLWVDIAPPMDGEERLQHLMIAQDTGGAIRGAVRGDVFWGYGDDAERLAGAMKSQGQYWLLLPRQKE